MAETVTIVKAKNAGEKDNPHGGTLTKWYLTVRKADGSELTDVYCQKKPTNPLSEGDEVYGRLEEGEFGWRLYPEQNPNGSQGRSGGSSGSFTPDPERQRRIERQHSQEMALRYLAISGFEVLGENRSVALAPVVRPIIDWFQADLDADGGGESDVRGMKATPTSSADTAAVSAHRDADGGGGVKGSEPPSSPAAAVSARVGFVVKPDGSTPQKDFFKRLLTNAGLDSNQVAAIVRFAEQLPTERISKAMDNLNDSDDEVADKTVAALLRESDAWARLQTDVPGEVEW